MPSPPDELLRALHELEVALEAFARVYDRWAAGDGAGSDELAAALTRAEDRLDAAREALAAIESRLRP